MIFCEEHQTIIENKNTVQWATSDSGAHHLVSAAQHIVSGELQLVSGAHYIVSGAHHNLISGSHHIVSGESFRGGLKVCLYNFVLELMEVY